MGFVWRRGAERMLHAPHINRPLERLRRIWADDIKMELKEII
jgi:hypothetical protein